MWCSRAFSDIPLSGDDHLYDPGFFASVHTAGDRALLFVVRRRAPAFAWDHVLEHRLFDHLSDLWTVVFSEPRSA